jgi:peroxiredoxin
VQAVKEKFDQQGVAITVVSFAEPERLVPYQRHHRWPFVLLSDPDRSAYRNFDLHRLPWYRLLSPSTLRLYLKLLIEGRKIQNYGKDDYYQAGGDFLVDRDGTVLFSYRSHDPSDRPPVSRLLAEIGRV